MANRPPSEPPPWLKPLVTPLTVGGRHFSTRPGVALSHVGALLSPHSIRTTDQHERVTVIEHFRIWQVSQISLSLIINTADNSATTLEITTNKAMQRVPWCTVRLWRVRITLSISKPVNVAFSCFLKSWDRVRAVHLSCQHALLQIVWKQQLHRHAINESKL